MQNIDARNSKMNEEKNLWIQWIDKLVSEIDLRIITSNIYEASTVYQVLC